jgi:hypothetical protein
LRSAVLWLIAFYYASMASSMPTSTGKFSSPFLVKSNVLVVVMIYLLNLRAASNPRCIAGAK